MRIYFNNMILIFSVVAFLAACAPKETCCESGATSIKVPKVAEPEWRSLFDGKSFGQWKPSNFGTQGELEIEDGAMILGFGDGCSGVTWSGDATQLPKMDYEIELKARRMEGNDFFCGLTFPVNDDPCSLILGGWGGGLVGLSSLDGHDAANNDTSTWMKFENNKWYTVRLRVRPGNISAWIDGEHVVDADLNGRTVGIRVEVEPSMPLGIATFQTTAGVKDIRVRSLPPEKKS